MDVCCGKNGLGVCVCISMSFERVFFTLPVLFVAIRRGIFFCSDYEMGIGKR